MRLRVSVPPELSKVRILSLQISNSAERAPIADPAPAPEPLGHYEERIWAPDPGAYGGRRARRGGPYRVFVPAEIARRSFALGDAGVAAVGRASAALARLRRPATGTAPLKALAANLLRSESAASSRIEGIAVSQRRLARAAHRGDGRDRRAVEVLGNVEAMTRAVEIGAGGPLSVADLLEIHRALLRFADDRGIAGRTRERQNWIGGNDFTPLGATFVPPPPELVPALLEDLCAFAARDDLAPPAQAAIAHAQFENIHPFADGNGRTGRALVYAILRRRDTIGGYVPPVSLVLAREQREYVSGLGAYSAGRLDRWCALFADAISTAAELAEEIAAAIGRLQDGWLARLGDPRSDAAVREIVAALPGHPVIDVASARALTGKSHVAVGRALGQLERAGVLTPLDERRWGRAWECPALLELVEGFERDLVSR